VFVTRKHLSRRAVLQGVGTALALPLLEAMAPAFATLGVSAATNKPRLACLEIVHGAAGSTTDGTGKHYWSPTKEGADFEFTQTLEPLSKLRDYLTIVTGPDLNAAGANTASEQGGDHFRSSAAYLTASHPEDDGRLRHSRRHFDRSDICKAIRAGQPAVFIAALH
jgi:hypothetical protein